MVMAKAVNELARKTSGKKSHAVFYFLFLLKVHQV